MKALLKIIPILFLTFTFFSCNNDNIESTEDNSLITVKEVSDFSTNQSALLKKEFLKI